MAENDKQEVDSKSSSDPKENTRSRIAMIYVCAFFGVIVVVFGIGLFSCFKVDEYKDMLVTVQAYCLGLLDLLLVTILRLQKNEHVYSHIYFG